MNGITAWAYWLGWFPVAPLNMILASYYLADRFDLNLESGFTPINTFIAWWTLAIAIVGILLFFIPAYLGIRFGAVFATVLGLLAMIPLTFLAVAWIFNPGAYDFGELSGFTPARRLQLLLGARGPRMAHGLHRVLVPPHLERDRLRSRGVLHRRDPEPGAGRKDRDDPLGGLRALHLHADPGRLRRRPRRERALDPDLVDPATMFVTFAGEIFGGSGGEVLNWLIAVMLIVALALSALNAIMGCARSLHQMSVDGQFPRFFQRINQHGVPARAMFFNVVASLVVVLLGGAVEIYSFSNVGYTFSFLPVLIGYYLLRRDRPNARRPFKLPEAFKYVALALAVLYAVIWLYGGIMYSTIFDTEIYYFLGWAVLLAYLPLYLYRTRIEDPRVERGAAAAAEPPGSSCPARPRLGRRPDRERRGASGRPFSKAATEEGQGRRAAESERAPRAARVGRAAAFCRGDLVRGAPRGADGRGSARPHGREDLGHEPRPADARPPPDQVRVERAA